MAKSTKFSGVVSTASARPWTNERTGDEVTLHSFQLEETGNRWFRTGTDQLVSRGQAVEFFADSQTNKVVADSVSQLESPPAPVPAKAPSLSRAASSQRATATSSSRDSYWEQKEKRDVEKDARYQRVDIPRMTFCTAQDAAVALVTSLLPHDIIPAATKKSDKLDLVLSIVDEVTERFFSQRMQGAAQEAKSAGVTVADGADEGDRFIE